jgi:hypothetical protein
MEIKNFNDYFKKDFNRVDFYEEYYKNLSPSDFKITKKDDEIIIKITETKNGKIKKIK